MKCMFRAHMIGRWSYGTAELLSDGSYSCQRDWQAKTYGVASQFSPKFRVPARRVRLIGETE